MCKYMWYNECDIAIQVYRDLHVTRVTWCVCIVVSKKLGCNTHRST